MTIASMAALHQQHPAPQSSNQGLATLEGARVSLFQRGLVPGGNFRGHALRTRFPYNSFKRDPGF